MGKRIPEEGKAFLPQGFQVRSQPVQFIETGLAPLLVAEGRTFFVQQPGDDAAVETVRYHFPGIPEQEEDKDAGTRMRSIKVSTLCVSQDGSAP